MLAQRKIIVTGINSSDLDNDCILRYLDNSTAREGISHIGVLRAYSTDYDHKWPLVTVNRPLTKRVFGNQLGCQAGWLDLLTVRFSLLSKQFNCLALVGLDKLAGARKIRVCQSYVYNGDNFDFMSMFFYWRIFSGHVIILNFKPLTKESSRIQEERTKILAECKPLDFTGFGGWQKGSRRTKNILTYASFFSLVKGLDLPVRLLSFGPEVKDIVKI